MYLMNPNSFQTHLFILVKKRQLNIIYLLSSKTLLDHIQSLEPLYFVLRHDIYLVMWLHKIKHWLIWAYDHN